MSNLSGPIWSFLSILGLSILGIAPAVFSSEIETQPLSTQQIQTQEIFLWSRPLIKEVDILLEQMDYATAVQHYQQMLATDAQPNVAIADILFQIGYLHDINSQPQQALVSYQQSLQILETLPRVKSAPRQAEIQLFVGWLFWDLGNLKQAKISLERSVSLYQEFQQSHSFPAPRFGDALFLLARINDRLGNLVDALRLYEQAYDIFKAHEDIRPQILAALFIGGMHTDLGNYDQAYKIGTEAFLASQTHKLQQESANILTLLGFIQRLRHRYESAINHYRQALTLKDQTDPEGTALTLNNLSETYLQLGKSKQAQIALNQALAQVNLVDSHQAQAQKINILDTFGDLYVSERAYNLAWEQYTFSLRLSSSLEDKIGQIITWINLAKLFKQQEQNTVAIAFYKQAINEIEQIRENLRSLPLETQQHYTETVAKSYRELTTLLLAQERVFEAQQVLDLLKIQELEEYLHDVRGDRSQVNEKLPYLDAEKILIEYYQTLLLKGQSETDPVLRQEDFLNHPAVTNALEILKYSDSSQPQPESLLQLQQKLQKLPHISAVLYPLVLEDRIELLLVPSVGTPIHRTTVIDKHQLTEQISKLRQNLADPSSDVKDLASTLYESVVAPLQMDLNRLKVENIIYVPDNVLHYIPLSVFYNPAKNQWIAEQYTSHNVTASNVGDLIQSPSRPFNVLAGAFADPNQTFEKLVDQKATNFYGLSHAGHEVSLLKDQIPETQVLLNADFSRNNLETQLQGHNVVHLATHAAFIPGQPEESFILLGDGDTITLKELRNWSLPNVDLVVLSACQTGISHIEDGLEILGMGFQVQRTDARAALASLWWVDDRSTSQLMELFYIELSAGVTKAEALQNAQRQLIANGKDEPYYWAPFVLIGNAL
ncbi:MAG: DUF2225 domain-containing protein [Leptolyngbya sp. SIO3F4]|nr:DUF2225 domain-containing protein [Leptolyngbya sp. SIO3F4]